MPKTSDRLPLFPLQTVLFPGRILPLRIFETRYLNMIRDCSRDQAPFGICLLIAEDEEQGGQQQQSRMAVIGTAAEIIDFSTTDDGLLAIVARGTRRFRVTATQVGHDGLISADIAWLPEPDAAPVQPKHALLVDVLRRLHDQISRKIEQHETGAGDIDSRALVRNCDYDDAASVGYALADLLPLPALDQQVLLEMNDADERLETLLQAISDSH